MFKLACRDLGQECDFVADGATKEEVMGKLMEHGKSMHAMTDEAMTPEMTQKAEAAVKEEV